MPEATKEQQNDEQILVQLRDDFRYVKSYWQENYDEAAKDMNTIACIPPPEFTADRSGRPCIWPDETSQYVKQSNNNLRQNKRSIKISPRSDDATDEDAQHRQSYIRGIEYASKAQSIFSTAYEAATECGFGFWRINTRITGPKGEQEPRIVRIPNQFTVYMDPDAKESDFSDSAICFVVDTMREKTFLQRYPKAKVRSFTESARSAASGWFQGDNITVAEYWTREESAIEDGEKRYKVTQRITNGVEILETNEWIGSWIPIIGVFGEEIYVRNGGQSKRMFLSLIRRARGPQTMLAYVASQEAEEFGMAPRAPLQGYKGQFDSEQHANIHKQPAAYLEFKLPSDWNGAWGPPPLPTRVAFIPNAQAYETAFERWRRSVQAAMGISPLPTAAQRQNEKSGVALERIQTQQAIGSFHFTDNFVRALGNTGLQLNELITKLAELDSLPQQLLGRDQRDEDQIIRVASRTGQPPAQDQSQQNLDQQNLAPASEHLPEADFFFAHRGQFAVGVSDGPNYLSQRDEASNFADTLLQYLPKLGIPPQVITQILSIAVKLKNIGSYGDEIADLLSPPDPNKLPPQVKAILAQAQGQVQQLTQKLQELQMEKLGKVTENQGKMQLAQLDAQVRMAESAKDREAKVLVAEVGTKAQSINERLTLFEDTLRQFHAQAHELAMSVHEHQQQKELAAQNAQHQQEQAVTQASLQPSPEEGQV